MVDRDRDVLDKGSAFNMLLTLSSLLWVKLVEIWSYCVDDRNSGSVPFSMVLDWLYLLRIACRMGNLEGFLCLDSAGNGRTSTLGRNYVGTNFRQLSHALCIGMCILKQSFCLKLREKEDYS